jgi:hypothetical protein
MSLPIDPTHAPPATADPYAQWWDYAQQIARAVKSMDVVYEVVVRFFVVMVQAVSAAGVTSCSVGVSLTVRDLLRTSRPR